MLGTAKTTPREHRRILRQCALICATGALAGVGSTWVFAAAVADPVGAAVMAACAAALAGFGGFLWGRYV